MNNTIWKYQISITDTQTLRVPRGAKPLSVQLQAGAPCIWMEVDSTAPTEDRIIEVFGTGNPFTEGERTFIGTVQTPPLVWHVYERHH